MAQIIQITKQKKHSVCIVPYLETPAKLHSKFTAFPCSNLNYTNTAKLLPKSQFVQFDHGLPLRVLFICTCLKSGL